MVETCFGLKRNIFKRHKYSPLLNLALSPEVNKQISPRCYTGAFTVANGTFPKFFLSAECNVEYNLDSETYKILYTY